MSKFRIPRKIKKKLSNDILFYPKNEVDQTYEVAFPAESQKDYDAWKRGELTSIIKELKLLAKNNKEIIIVNKEK